MAKSVGRRKGGRNKGYFYRTGRGWYTRKEGGYSPLLGLDGEHIREKDTESRILKEAAAFQMVQPEPERKLPEIDTEVGQVCAVYLDHLRESAGEIGPNPTGKAKTYIDRGQTLFDFCFGLPGEFFCAGDKDKRKKKGDPEPKRIHPGFGDRMCSDLKPGDIDAWFKAHKWSDGGKRTRVQAVKRAFNFGVERKLIEVSPIRGYLLTKSAARITYLKPEQEAAMIAAASPAFAIALRVCIRTGARFGCEFAALHSRHIRDHGDRMEWVFKAEESKTGKQRTIRIMDAETIAFVRKAVEQHPDGPVFRNKIGEPWTRRMLSQNFRRAKAKVQKKGVQLDDDACMYSCRHTYAKRTLEGHWTGKPASISTLARLMGNSVQVCIKHYLQFSGADNEMLWSAA